MKIIPSIHFQQSERVTQNSALREAAGKPNPPKLSDDESSLIQKKFAPAKPMKTYTMQGAVSRQEFGCGRNIDTRV